MSRMNSGKRGHLIASIAADIHRTPLTLVSGPLDDMLAETKEGPKRDMLIMARRNVYVTLLLH
jgi:hypothetical protein